MQIKGKSGDSKMISGETVKIIIAVAVVLVLVVLMYNLISPVFNKEKETAKSYLNSLEEVLSILDEGEVEEFSLWGGEPKMVYFGDNRYVELTEDDTFFRGSREKNYLCFCYQSGDKWKCDFCKSLKYPVVFTSNNVVYEDGWMFKISLEGNYYKFEPVSIRNEK